VDENSAPSSEVVDADLERLTRTRATDDHREVIDHEDPERAW
jgi:hypothetical protein